MRCIPRFGTPATIGVTFAFDHRILTRRRTVGTPRCPDRADVPARRETRAAPAACPTCPNGFGVWPSPFDRPVAGLRTRARRSPGEPGPRDRAWRMLAGPPFELPPNVFRPGGRTYNTAPRGPLIKDITSSARVVRRSISASACQVDGAPTPVRHAAPLDQRRERLGNLVRLVYQQAGENQILRSPLHQLGDAQQQRAH